MENNEKLDSAEEMNDEDFKKMLEDSLPKRDEFNIGDEVTGRVAFISKEYVFLDISSKSEAIINLSEFNDENGNTTIKVGDTIKAFIVSMKGGEIQLTTSIGKGHASQDLIEKAYSYNIPVEGVILNTIKGGYSVSISGVQCFCPFSQIDIKSSQNPEDYIAKTFSFKITEYSENGRNIVLSRRSLLEEKRETRHKEIFDKFHNGDIIPGKIINIQNFGLIVDLDGAEALVPRSETSWGRNSNLDSFKIGDNISAKIISIEENNNKIVLSIKQLTPEPWQRIKQYSIGQSLNGKIINIIKNGAFAELEPGLEGFIPISKMSIIKRVNKPEDIVKIGDIVNVKISDIRYDEKKISLELLTGEPDPWQLSPDDLMDKIFDSVIESSRPNGLSVRLSNGMLGFLPKEDLINRGDVQNLYSVGKEIKVAIKDIDSKNKRLFLSEKNAVKLKEFQEFEEFQKKSQTQESTSAFGKLLKERYNEIKNKKDDAIH